MDAPGFAVVAPVIGTERLTLSPFTPADAGELHEIFTEPDVRRYLLDDTVVSREWVEEEVASSQARFAESGCGLWTLREHAREGIVGFVGFRPFFDPPELQLLYGLLPSHWGCGYATEAAGAAIDYALRVVGLEEVCAATDSPNSASIAVLRRLGMHERPLASGASSGGTLFFRLAASEWTSRGR